MIWISNVNGILILIMRSQNKKVYNSQLRSHENHVHRIRTDFTIESFFNQNISDDKSKTKFN